ncbi:MAG: type II secretion system protein GspL, partial [Pseudomonadota bacterium]
MSLLALHPPPRPRLGTRSGADLGSVAQAPAAFGWVLSPDGVGVAATGVAPATALPRADRTVLVLD